MSLKNKIGSQRAKVETSRYILEINPAQAQALLIIKGTHQRYLFFPGGACNPLGKRDETMAFGRISKTRAGNTVTITLPEKSSRWQRKVCTYVCAEDYIEFFYTVEGRDTIERAHFFRGYFHGEERGMACDIDEVYSTCPNFQEKLYFHPGESLTISAGNCLDLPVGCQALASPCYCMGLHDRRDSKFVSVGLATQPGRYTWDAFQWNPPVLLPVTAYVPDNVLAGAFAAVYDGKLKIQGQWESPRLVLMFADDHYDVLKKYLQHCRQFGYLPKPPRRKPAAWWLEPIYCTWHDQVAKAGATNVFDGTGGSVKASDVCTQKLCDRWVKMLEKQHCKPGTVILDATWAIHQNSGMPDLKKWPDMRRWIDQCHARGIRVFLWFAAWLPEGLPPEECITRNGTPVAGDVTNPAYRSRFRETIRRWFADGPDCLNADGIKIDGMLGVPTGAGLKNHGNLWGLELQKVFLKMLYEEAKRYKPDVCISTFALNPYLAEFTDMVRVGDMYNSRVTAHNTLLHRVALYNIAMPHAVIDTDGQFSHYALDDYASELFRQAELGVPTLYNAEWVYRHRWFQPLCITKLTPTDYKEFARVFAEHRQALHSGKK